MCVKFGMIAVKTARFALLSQTFGAGRGYPVVRKIIYEYGLRLPPLQTILSKEGALVQHILYIKKLPDLILDTSS